MEASVVNRNILHAGDRCRGLVQKATNRFFEQTSPIFSNRRKSTVMRMRRPWDLRIRDEVFCLPLAVEHEVGAVRFHRRENVMVHGQQGRSNARPFFVMGRCR